MASELTPEDVGKMKVADLRAELKARDLSTTGLKKELADRLLEHLSSGTEGGEAAAASNGAEATGAAPDNGADVPESAAPSGDSTAQTAAEAAPVQASTEEASTDNLPGEMPAIPPVTEDSVDDFTGAEGTIAEETATVGVEKSNEPSEVVHPHPDHLDKIPGFVADSKSEEAREKAEVVPLNESAVLPGHDEASHKRKHDDLEEPVMSAPESAVKSVAEQEESSAPANDEITADPAAASILNGAPEAKRPRTDEAASNDDIAVPQETSSLAVEDVPTMPLDASTNGASASTFPTSVITPGINESTSMPSGGASSIGNTPDVVTLNEPQQPAVDFASAAPGEAIAASTNGTADASAVGSETKSVQMCFRPSHASFSYVSSSAPPCLPPLPWYRTDHVFTIAGSSKEAQDTKGGVSSIARSLDEQDASSSHLSSSTSLYKDTKTELSNQTNVAIPSTSTTSISTNISSTPTLPHQNADQQQQNGPPVSRSICISNLVRPFTLPALKEKLEDFGEMDYFWINSIKSHCFVTYQSTDIAQQASQSLEGEIWPEAVGKPLSVTYLPSEKIASLVEKEQAAGRTRLELVTSFDSESNEWQYDVVAPIAAAKSLGQAPPVPRGLASSLPFQARVAAPAAGPSGPGRLDPRNMVTATSASGAAIRLPSNSAFAQSRPPVSRSAGPSAAPEPSTDSGKPWLPKAGAEDLYHKTKTAPELYYRAVDKVAAGRRLRELERGPYVPRPGAGDRRAGPPASSYRDRYRP